MKGTKMPAPLHRDGRTSTNRKGTRMSSKPITHDSVTEALERFDDVFDFHYPDLGKTDVSVANMERFTAAEIARAVDILIDYLPQSVLL